MPASPLSPSEAIDRYQKLNAAYERAVADHAAATSRLSQQRASLISLKAELCEAVGIENPESVKLTELVAEAKSKVDQLLTEAESLMFSMQSSSED